MDDTFLNLIFNIPNNYMTISVIYHFYLKEWRLMKSESCWHDKTVYIIHITNLKQALNQELGLKKVNRVIKFNQNA